MQTKELLSIPIDISRAQFFEMTESWLKHPNSDSIKERGGSLYQFVHFLDQEAYDYLHEEAWEDDSTIAFLMYSLNELGSKIDNIEVYINRASFYRDGVDYSHLIPVVIRHETAELFYLLSEKNEIADGYAHKQAVIEEFKFAQSFGMAGEYIQLIMKWALDLSSPRKEEFIKENLDAYLAVSKTAK